MGARAKRRWCKAMQGVRDLLCSWGRCSQCRRYETSEGIGGQCINCGKVHGWMTSAELCAIADRDAAALASDWATLGRDFRVAAQKLDKSGSGL